MVYREGCEAANKDASPTEGLLLTDKNNTENRPERRRRGAALGSRGDISDEE